MVKKKKVKKKSVKEVCETFKVSKDGKSKTMKTCGPEPQEHATKKQIQEQNKLLRNTLIVIGTIIILTLVVYFIFSGMKTFEFEGMSWDVIKEGSIVFYHTSFPMWAEGKHVANFNVYIRNNPKSLQEDIPFDGRLAIRNLLIIELTDDFVCGGHGAISVANMKDTFKATGIEVGKDPEASCDPEGRYSYALIQEGEETKIEQFGPSCYNIYVNNCEIMKATERFTLELLKKIDIN